MSDTGIGRAADQIVLEYKIDAPPEKVWRALSIPEFRERWLPAKDLADPAPVSSAPGEELRYRMRDPAPPFLESIVTLHLRPDTGGGTCLRIVHDLTDERLQRIVPPAANANGPPQMRAA